MEYKSAEMHKFGDTEKYMFTNNASEVNYYEEENRKGVHR